MRTAPFAAALLLLAGPAPALAQSLTPQQRTEIVSILRETLRADPSILRDAVAAMQADDARREAAAQQDMIVLLGDTLVTPADPVLGNALATATIVEFFDTRCPYCRRMLPTHAALLAADPNLRIVFKDLPILGPASQLESRALLAAQRQGGYFKLQDAIMRDGPPPTRDTLRAQAERLGLDGGRLLRDMDDPAIKAQLDANVALARKIGIQGTPALIVGKTLFAGLIELGDLQQAVANARAGQ